MQRVDVGQMAARERMSVEEAGREARYHFMEELCQKLGGNKVATAHHRSDQAETVLLHLIQGTGAKGLQGILPQRGRIIRPLLGSTRMEIMAYLNDNSLPYRIDSSNFDNNYLRNRIRWELLPLLEERFNPSMVDVLCRLAELMKEENSYWDELIKGLLSEAMTEGEDTPMIASIGAIQQMPKAKQRRLLHYLLGQESGQRVTWDDVERVLDLISRGGSNRKVPVTGGKWVRKSYNVLEFGVEESVMEGFCYRLEVPGSIVIKEMGLRLTTRLLSEPPSTVGEVAVFDWERLRKPLYIRSRLPGDSFRPVGLAGSKKLKKYLIDKKIPLSERNRIGILAADDEIYWVIGHRQDERGRVSEATQQFLEVRVSNVEK
jgi:tRNA(Ile)-lysidine synthase